MEEKRYVFIFFCYTLFHDKYLQVYSCVCIMSLNDAFEFISAFTHIIADRFVKSVHIMQSY